MLGRVVRSIWLAVFFLIAGCTSTRGPEFLQDSGLEIDKPGGDKALAVLSMRTARARSGNANSLILAVEEQETGRRAQLRMVASGGMFGQPDGDYGKLSPYGEIKLLYLKPGRYVLKGFYVDAMQNYTYLTHTRGKWSMQPVLIPFELTSTHDAIYLGAYHAGTSARIGVMSNAEPQLEIADWSAVDLPLVARQQVIDKPDRVRKAVPAPASLAHPLVVGGTLDASVAEWILKQAPVKK